MNGTMLSQIVWVMFLAHHGLPKVAKNLSKKGQKLKILLLDVVPFVQLQRSHADKVVPYLPWTKKGPNKLLQRLSKIKSLFEP